VLVEGQAVHAEMLYSIVSEIVVDMIHRNVNFVRELWLVKDNTFRWKMPRNNIKKSIRHRHLL
ncbi:MAG: hypothetical protein K2H14_06340, partial [Muribaculaceae bacterium]|nr:hypothetical protein [Muribaculaceae bacterium]